MSPSVWREWIEINREIIFQGTVFCLPPCGGSGLKCDVVIIQLDLLEVSLRVEGVD